MELQLLVIMGEGGEEVIDLLLIQSITNSSKSSILVLPYFLFNIPTICITVYVTTVSNTGSMCSPTYFAKPFTSLFIFSDSIIS